MRLAFHNPTFSPLTPPHPPSRCILFFSSPFENETRQPGRVAGPQVHRGEASGVCDVLPEPGGRARARHFNRPGFTLERLYSLSVRFCSVVLAGLVGK